MDITTVCSAIDKRFVHKDREENVLIGNVRQISTEPEEFECEMVVDPHQPFFFEHPADHVPGIMMVEAGRQMGLAISHLFWNVPFGTRFVTRDLRIHFTTFAELTEPVTIRTRFHNKCYRHGALSEAQCRGEFIQGGKVVTELEGDWKMYPPDIYEHFRVHRIEK